MSKELEEFLQTKINRTYKSESLETLITLQELLMIKETVAQLKLKHRDFTCPMASTCSSLGWISEDCSVKCYLKTTKVGEKT